MTMDLVSEYATSVMSEPRQESFLDGNPRKT
jgi:hypothetical protein